MVRRSRAKPSVSKGPQMRFCACIRKGIAVAHMGGSLSLTVFRFPRLLALHRNLGWYFSHSFPSQVTTVV